MFKSRKYIFLICIFIVISILCSTSVSAVSFTHRDNIDGSSSTVLSYDTYYPVKSYSASDFGLNESFKGLSDFYIDKDGSIYLLCSDASSIVVLNDDYTFNRSFKLYDDNGKEIKLKGCKGIYVHGEDLYVCDTNHERIILCDLDGNIKEFLLKPESSLVPADFIYQPIRILKDNDGFTYVLSAGCFYGLLTFSSENEFLGFYGANKVQTTVLDTFSYLFDLITSNDTKKSASEKKLPYSFVDIAVDSEGFITACTGKTENWNNTTGQIRKLSPTGINIIQKRKINGSSTSADNFNFQESSVVSKFSETRTQNFVSVECTDDGYIYALDQTYGLVYVYDNDCNLISSFGGGVGKGKKLGEFNKAVALGLKGDELIVADEGTASFTVFTKTEYGKMLFEAQSLHLRGDYEEAFPIWQKIIAFDAGNQLAYRGIARAYYNDKDYVKAKEYAIQGNDLVTYDLAHQEILKSFVAKYFIFIILGIAILVGLIIFLFVRKKSEVTKNSKYRMVYKLTFSPFTTSSDIKYKNKGSLLYATIVLFLFFFAIALESTATGFLFRTVDIDNYNVLYTIVKTIGLVILWSISNWLVCTLFSGKGKLSEIYILTSYSLVPLIVFTFVKVILSHVLALNAAGLINGIYIAVLLYTIFILAVSIMTAHEYSFTKTLATAVVSIVGMVLVVFIIFMMVILLQQFWNLIYSICLEIFY